MLIGSEFGMELEVIDLLDFESSPLRDNVPHTLLETG
jgi:hypothetical protein